ncbi:hypothetical protein WDZ92_53890, partial [Nostoc sp. NIES-2111]
MTITGTGAVQAVSGDGISVGFSGSSGYVLTAAIYGIGQVDATQGTAIIGDFAAGSSGIPDTGIFIGVNPDNADDAAAAAAKLSQSITGLVGIDARVSESASIAIATKAGGTVTGTSGKGIVTSAKDGATTIDIGDTVRGKTDAISATATGTGNITIYSTARIASEYKANADDLAYTDGTGNGISASSQGGANAI